VASPFDAILTSRQLVFVAGKGGVGKSTVCATLALRAKELGLRPLLFECDAPMRTQSLFENGKAFGVEVDDVAPGILGINQKSEDAIRDYAASTLPSRTVAELLFENRIAKTFLQAAPSVTEMALMGRMVLLAERYGSDGPIIVDLHATGHALSLLRAPQGIMSVLRIGPLFDRAKKIDALLKDATQVAFVGVAAPEELPITELLELLQGLRELRAPLGPVVVNGGIDALPPVPAAVEKLLFASKDAAVVQAMHDHRMTSSWAARSAREEARLREHAGVPVVRLPFVAQKRRPIAHDLVAMLKGAA
jgi:arsenite/tail-anchored protein-transporting ATPase